MHTPIHTSAHTHTQHLLPRLWEGLLRSQLDRWRARWLSTMPKRAHNYYRAWNGILFRLLQVCSNMNLHTYIHMHAITTGQETQFVLDYCAYYFLTCVIFWHEFFRIRSYAYTQRLQTRNKFAFRLVHVNFDIHWYTRYTVHTHEFSRHVSCYLIGIIVWYYWLLVLLFRIIDYWYYCLVLFIIGIVDYWYYCLVLLTCRHNVRTLMILGRYLYVLRHTPTHMHMSFANM
jgi:hypothetical protein